MKRWSWAPLLLALGLAAGAANAAQGDWLGRARVININPDASSSALNLDASTETTLELDFTYFVTRNLGLELILATKKHNITSNGSPIGPVALLPPVGRDAQEYSRATTRSRPTRTVRTRVKRGDPDRFLALPQGMVAFRGESAVSLALIPAGIVEAALAGKAAESAEHARRWVRQQSKNTVTPSSDPGLAGLTPREWEIARRLAEGDRVQLMVEDLGIAENTVRNHLKSIFRKLRVASQAQLVCRIRRASS